MKRVLFAILLGALVALSSCAYYNTYYLAKKNYDKATAGEPYVVDPATGTQSQQYYGDSMKYAKKLLSQYPKSKWVDDAYLLWALDLMGRDDPLETANMLESFTTRYPNSPIRSDVTFFLGVAYRRGHKPADALRSLDDFMAQNPKHRYVPYAMLERSRALYALDRHAEAADAAAQLIERAPKGPLVPAALQARSDALFADGQFAAARDDYHELGFEATDDETRFAYLLREADCLDGAHQYDQEIELLKSALAHEREPVLTTQTTANGTSIATAPTGLGADHWGKLRLRIGAAHLLAGRLEPAIQEYNLVITSYPRTALAAEAQYRIGYAYETQAEDFDRARTEYNKVKDQTTMGGFAQMASGRVANLDRLVNFKGATGRDSTDRKAESRFMLAELYLFQHDKPERALEEYRAIENDYRGTPWGGKALNAQAWVLKHKLDRPQEADSLLWIVVRDYRATDAQLAARDYLEGDGVEVPDTLIERPQEPVESLAADTLSLTPPPATVPPIGTSKPALAGAPGTAPGAPSAIGPGGATSRPPGGLLLAPALARDTTQTAAPPTLAGATKTPPADTTHAASATSAPATSAPATSAPATSAPATSAPAASAPADTSHARAPADTTGKRP